MATPKLELVPRRSLIQTVLRAILIFLAIVLITLLAVVGWFYSAARAALPQVDGMLRLAGLAAPVTVFRDLQGVPHISAGSLPDLLFAQGYVTAQDRLWQMDVSRRAAAGELAEVLGKELVARDREQRILQPRVAAERGAAALDSRARTDLEAYAGGVNAFIENHRNHLPMEFRVLRYAPRPWTIQDSILVAVEMCQQLNHGTFEFDLEHEKILAKLGPELTADLYINSSWRDFPPSATTGQMENSPKPAAAAGDASPPSAWQNVGRSQTEISELMPGSNNWVVSGAHTISGKPLLSNDMHLGHRIPGVWYEAHLESGSFNVAGVTLPGLPYVIVGHNQRIAWGFTNLGPDVEDVFIENFNQRGEYETPEGWQLPEHRHEVIHIKGQPDMAFDVLVTRHGPIVNELVPGERRPLALQWSLYDPRSVTAPFFAINAAQTWDQFRRAFSRFGGPAQNVVYADVDGHIGYQATGFIPIRPLGDGSLPVSGSDNVHEWKGYVPFEKLPRVFDPPSGVLATANGRIAPESYPYSLSNQWGAPYRTQRIYTVLKAPQNSRKKFSAADMLALQTDIYSEYDRFCAERLVYAVDHARSVSARARQAAELMRRWEGKVATDSAAAIIVARARYHLARLLLEPKLGRERRPLQVSGLEASGWRQYSWPMASVWLENVLEQRPARWLPQNYPNYDELLAAAVEAAIAPARGASAETSAGEITAPRDLISWHWGRQFPIELQHPIFGRVPILQRFSGPGVQPQSGGSYTVKQVGRRFGPSERMTVDLADLDSSTLNIVTGESGNIFSDHYMDQWRAWYEGQTFALPFSHSAVEKARAHRLELQPAR